MIHPVTNDEEHECALRRVDELSSSDPASERGKELDAILTLVEKYEQERWPLQNTLDPIDLLKQAMTTEVGHTRSELIDLVGSASRVSELLSRKRRLSLAQIRAISESWGIPIQLLSSRYDLTGATAEGAAGVLSRGPGSRVPEPY